MRSTMIIPTEPIGSIPRPVELIDALARKDSDDPSLVPLYEAAVRDTIERFEATGSPIVTDGDRVLEAARYIPVAQLRTTDDCGFSPFSDDTSTTRDVAFPKIRARVRGTALAGETLSCP
jgi:methionine synthase II (cobalamin-independent)